jgi:hypothetical protein
MPIEFGSVSGLVAAFGKVPAEVRIALRPAVLEAGNLIADAAKANASWSGRIPGAISVTSNLTSSGGAVIRVDSTTAPHARPYEGRSGSPFRHPVFGNRDNWVSQATRPFLKPARDSEGDKARALIGEAVTEVTKRLI